MSNKTAVVTGVSGFSGSFMARVLASGACTVLGIDVTPPAGLAPSAGRLPFQYRQVDILDPAALRAFLRAVRPDEVYHLAGLMHPPRGAGDDALYRVNVGGTIHLLEALRLECPACRVLITGSSAQYGLVHPGENPISETQRFRPISHYGISKVAQELVGYRYWAAHSLQVVQTRTFNLIGPRQSLALVASAFAHQIVQIEQGRQEPVINVGNLDALRDLIDVRDAVRAYVRALRVGQPGEAYNVCSGRAVRIRVLLDRLLLAARRDDISVRLDPSRLQLVDVPLQVGDYSRLNRETGWEPRFSLEQTLADLLDYWRSALSEAQP
ncbi:MAG: GDP-mannose 4,6-dehydratase [Anaerolineae bacterium]|nr:GDP-mannose 4,6-dehydratase [Anaerolineae bacterium]